MNHTERTATILVHLDALYNLAMWLTYDATDAQALVRATLRQALDLALESIPGTKLRVRLLTIMWESYCRHHATPADGAGPIPLGQVPSGKRSLLRTLSRVDLDAAVRQLPPTLRATLILSDMEGHSCQEVAVILGWTRDQVQTGLVQARRQLSDGLQARLTSTPAWPAAEDEDSQ